MSSAEVAKRYFPALAAREVDRAVAGWSPGALGRFVGQQERVAPEGARTYLTGLCAAFADFAFDVLEKPTAVWPGHADALTGGVASARAHAAQA